MTTPGAGLLTAQVRFHGSVIEAIELKLQRPLQLLAGFHGKRPAECLRLLPLLFPLCGTAHALAALQAIEVAASMKPGLAHATARKALAVSDMLAAQVWRTCIDWAQLTGMPIAPKPVAQARRLVERIALGVYPDGDWQRLGGGRLAPDGAALAAVREDLQQLRARVDAAGDGVALRSQMVIALRGAEPEWTPRIERCFAAMSDAMATSFHALDSQLEALAQLPPAPSSDELTDQSGRGSGVALTARGELRYEFELVCAHVAACRMSAPTDREFAADGPVAQLLQRLRRADDPLLAVRWVLAGYDPCIEVQVEAAGD